MVVGAVTMCIRAAFVVVVAVVLTATLVAACPPMCSCKWRSGKEAVDCSDKDLITIPESLDSVTQWLNFSGNNLQTLGAAKFQKLGLTNLQRVYLARCRLTSIDDRAFEGLTNLVDLDLSENYLTSIPSDSFLHYPSIMKLVLSNNPISVLHREAFKFAPALHTLELSNCEIELIEDGAFLGVSAIEWLKMDGNRLTTIRGQNILPTTLHGLNLVRNNWQCDCHMLDLHSWLHNFDKVPMDVEPVCSGPTRLSGREIRSIDVTDFACLPDVSPTTLYLEIGEGKNLSLQCKVKALPEAHVSWLFQGQVLQNDTLIGPGLHLYYYIEEGVEEKRSELFIYNTSPEDNGTYTCLAENAAGRAQANYTIRIVVKEEPAFEEEQFPFEYMMAIYSGIIMLVFILLTIIIVSIVKCRRNRRRKKKKNRNKEIAVQCPTTTEKCSVINENSEISAEPVKVTGNVMLTEGHHEMVIFAAMNPEDILNSVTAASCSTQFRSPPSLRNYQNEQNPDLINDTETVGQSKRRECDGEEDVEANGPSSYQETVENVMEEMEAMIKPPAIRQVHWKDMPHPVRVGSRELCQHTADVHLNPGCLLDAEGYPVDYGLPKVLIRPQMQNGMFYRTLPHNRNAKRISAANPVSRFSREAEFLSLTSQQPASYEHYCPTDVRYTVDGYPKPHPPETLYTDGSFSENNYIPSPPEAYKTDSPISLPGCTTTLPRSEAPQITASVNQWPACLPVGLHMPCREENKSSFAKKCASAQTASAADRPFSRKNSVDQSTETDSGAVRKVSAPQPASAPQAEGIAVAAAAQESPDEGYVGEGAETVEM